MDSGEKAENPIMRADEVRKMLGIGRNTLYNWCEQGIIPHKRIGRVILFSRKRIQEWLENNENERRENWKDILQKRMAGIIR